MEILFVKKNPLQDFLSSLNAVISTNESTQIYNRSCELYPGLYLQIPSEKHPRYANDIVVLGGLSNTDDSLVLASTEIYDSAQNAKKATGSSDRICLPK